MTYRPNQERATAIAKLADRISDALRIYLEPDEELRSVGQMTSGAVSSQTALLPVGVGAVLIVMMKPWWVGAAVLLAGGIGYLLLVKTWWVGITNKRVVLTPLTALSRPVKNVRFTIPLDSVELTENRMAVSAPEEGLPHEFRFYFGGKRATGLKLEEFKRALETRR